MTKTVHLHVGETLETLGEREGSAARLKEAVAAYRAALKERMREKVPLDWAMTQMNLGNALSALGERETDAAWLEEAVTAFDACLAVTASVWPSGWVEAIEARRDRAQARPGMLPESTASTPPLLTTVPLAWPPVYTNPEPPPLTTVALATPPV